MGGFRPRMRLWSGETALAVGVQADAGVDPLRRAHTRARGKSEMASYPALRRPGKRPARAGRLVVRVPLIVVVLALVGAAAVAFQLTGFDGTSSKAKPATLSPSV